MSAFAVAYLILCSSCSDQKTQKMPKTHPELLLEITDEAKKNNFQAMLPKIARLRAIDPTNTFTAELEDATKMNILVKKINFLAASGRFMEALKIVEQYERLNGPGPVSDKVKERLSNLVLLEKWMKELNSPRNSMEFHHALLQFESLGKKIRFSQKLRNFASKKRSELARFRVAEYGGICFGLWSDALDLKASEDPAYPVLTAILESAKSDFPGFYLLMPHPDQQE